MSSFDSSTHRLAGSGSESGGLILKSCKTKESGSSDNGKDTHVFKKPTTSLLGLDRLARKKREEREAESSFAEKKAKLYVKGSQSDCLDSDVRISFGKATRMGDSSKERKYRGTLVETPSHTGGVNEEALQRIHCRLAEKDQRTHGVYASTTKTSGRERRRDQRPRYICIYLHRLVLYKLPVVNSVPIV